LKRASPTIVSGLARKRAAPGIKPIRQAPIPPVAGDARAGRRGTVGAGAGPGGRTAVRPYKGPRRPKP